LLPILKDVVDNAESYYQAAAKNGEKRLYYCKTFPDIGVQVVVKIWVSSDGLIQKLSDAIPYILD